MAFLRLNGLQIHVEPTTAKDNLLDTGRASRGTTGGLTKDRIYMRRKWSFKTQLLPMIDMMALWDWLHNQAWTFPFDTVATSNIPSSMTLSTTATNVVYNPYIAADGLPSLYDATYSYAIAVCHSTTNAWSSNVASGTDTGSNTTGFQTLGASSTITSDTAHAWQGSRSLKTVSTGATSGFQTSTLTSSNGAYAASFYIVSSSSVTLTAQLKSSGSVLVSKTFTANPNAWLRVTLPMLGIAISAGADIHIEVSGTGTYWCDGFQLEVGGYTTAWVNGSRSSNALFVNTYITPILGGPRGCAVSLWSAEPQVPSGATYFRMVDLNPTHGSNPTEFSLKSTSGSSTLRLFVCNDAGVSWTMDYSALAWKTESPRHHILATVNPGGHGLPEMGIYVDGVLVQSGNPGITGMDLSRLGELYVGNDNGAFFHNAYLDDLTIFPYPVGANVALSIANYGNPMFQIWASLYAEGDAMREGPVNVVGKVDGIEFTPFVDSTGTMQSNGGQVSFTLMEI